MQVSLPTFEMGLPAYYILAFSEASSNLSRYDGIRYGLRKEVHYEFKHISCKGISVTFKILCKTSWKARKAQ